MFGMLKSAKPSSFLRRAFANRHHFCDAVISAAEVRRAKAHLDKVSAEHAERFPGHDPYAVRIAIRENTND